ncbi:DUF1178 family protein [Parasphingopyxis lamellibrachiae]|uniref:Putative regulatory protein FmdB zinc ribbon domain-containing protein n=1 Tax=Parasphingopyxis lamellibrachiae TaxID=680125 RepID=A0A3D9FFM0_9SPHN|nr:DUF1178 family protein [Parasphingopyxis lamellibrachiae]RED15916.1 hypothetical protein DFR46_0925 [Parasphingopyxis lamellibrachiae]
MIVFDLQCEGAGHVFEAWFGSSADFEDQRERGLVACPLCGSDKVRKAIMAPAVGAKGNRQGSEGKELAVSNDMPEPAQMKAMLETLAREQAKALEKSDYVGKDFASEARAMHDGEIDDRPIHGQTSLDEAKALVEDGVPVAPLPLPIRPPKTDN